MHLEEIKGVLWAINYGSINWAIRLFINAIETEIIESLQVLSAKSIEIASNEQNDAIENESRIVGGRTGKRF